MLNRNIATMLDDEPIIQRIPVEWMDHQEGEQVSRELSIENFGDEFEYFIPVEPLPENFSSQYRLVTLAGNPVYNYGMHNYTLEYAAHRLPAFSFDFPLTIFNLNKLAQASQDVGECLKWIKVEPEKIMEIFN